MAASASPALKPPLAVKKKLMPLLLTSISSVIKNNGHNCLFVAQLAGMLIKQQMLTTDAKNVA